MESLAAEEHSQATVLCPHLKAQLVRHGCSNSQICQRKLSSCKVLRVGFLNSSHVQLLLFFFFFLAPPKGMEVNS